MRLVPKLCLAFIAGVSIVLAANGYLRVDREVALFESDRVRDDVVIGETLGAAVETVWRSNGADEALAMIRHADAKQGRVHVRWAWLDESDATWSHERLSSVIVPGRALANGEAVATSSFDGRRFTLVPVSTSDGRRGAIEVSEPMAIEQAYIRRTIVDTAVTMFALDAMCAALATLLGAWLVGRPVGALMDKARRVGRGDFGAPLHLAQKDELAELADEMNTMCSRLVDAQERVSAETRARIAMLEQLRHADRLMTVGKLASGIAHELGTPLNVVEARAGMIASGETTPAESSEFARVIVRASEQMTRIIRQVLTFARPRAAAKAEVILDEIARHTLDLLKPFAAKKNVTLAFTASPEPVVTLADGGQIEQALTNLVMNAIQSMDRPGTVCTAVERGRARAPADQGGMDLAVARIRVRDDGRGIAEEHVSRLFEPFFTTKDVGEGTGLGLSVTYGIVREHGGWIDVTSKEGRGSEFVIHLPIAS